jgi:hypothetical protein
VLWIRVGAQNRSRGNSWRCAGSEFSPPRWCRIRVRGPEMGLGSEFVGAGSELGRCWIRVAGSEFPARNGPFRSPKPKSPNPGEPPGKPKPVGMTGRFPVPHVPHEITHIHSHPGSNFHFPPLVPQLGSSPLSISIFLSLDGERGNGQLGTGFWRSPGCSPSVPHNSFLGGLGNGGAAGLAHPAE